MNFTMKINDRDFLIEEINDKFHLKLIGDLKTTKYIITLEKYDNFDNVKEIEKISYEFFSKFRLQVGLFEQSYERFNISGIREGKLKEFSDHIYGV